MLNFETLLVLQAIATRMAWDVGYLFSHIATAQWLGPWGTCDWCSDWFANDPQSTQHAALGECRYCSSCCDNKHVSYCGSCEVWSSYGDACDGCNYCSSCCDCRCQCDDCVASRSSDGPLSNVAPWVRRGVNVDFDADSRAVSYREVWGFDETQVDPVRVFADFYVCEYIANTTFNGLAPRATGDAFLVAASNEASDRVDALCANELETLTGYLRMVVWGEARYHRAVVASAPSGGRKTYWNNGKAIVEQVGADAYRDLRDLFNEQGEGAYGGPKWATVCDLLWQYERGLIPPRVWLDRCCTLQHNGGSIWNKVSWLTDNPATWDVNAIPTYLGPAQAMHPIAWPVLLAVASPAVTALWTRWFDRRKRYHSETQTNPAFATSRALRSPARVIAEHNAIGGW